MLCVQMKGYWPTTQDWYKFWKFH